MLAYSFVGVLCTFCIRIQTQDFSPCICYLEIQGITTFQEKILTTGGKELIDEWFSFLSYIGQRS